MAELFDSAIVNAFTYFNRIEVSQSKILTDQCCKADVHHTEGVIIPGRAIRIAAEMLSVNSLHGPSLWQGPPFLNLHGASTMNERLRMMQRQPRRITITLSYHVHEALLTRSEEEGRSVSNLCAFLLEDSLRHPAVLPTAQGSAATDGKGYIPSYAVESKVRGNGDLRGG